MKPTFLSFFRSAGGFFFFRFSGKQKILKRCVPTKKGESSFQIGDGGWEAVGGSALEERMRQC